jgi:transcription initiation factor TFIIIB Brf1 subunit/transcription initiation factor TFIIB
MTPDGEYVCSKCGIVLSDSGYDLPEDEKIDSSLSPSSSPITNSQMPNPNSNISLFLSHKLGGREVRNLPGLSTARSLEIANREDDNDYSSDKVGEKKARSKKKKKGANAYLSRFSNACSKLGLTHAESEHAWHLFSSLCDELRNPNAHIVINTSEIACYTIAAGVAATTKRVLGERAIASAVMFAFHSKSVRDLYCIRRIVETHSEAVTGISKPALTASAKWIRGRY